MYNKLNWAFLQRKESCVLNGTRAHSSRETTGHHITDAPEHILAIASSKSLMCAHHWQLAVNSCGRICGFGTAGPVIHKKFPSLFHLVLEVESVAKYLLIMPLIRINDWHDASKIKHSSHVSAISLLVIERY